jgi:exodeoxyribonuclease-3
MKIATYNVNGVDGRLSVLIRWLKEKQPDIVCLQELKAPRRNSPSPKSVKPVTARSGVARKAGTASPSLREGPVETRRGLPGDPEDMQPLYRSCRRRPRYRVPLPAERQSRAWPQVRLQAGVV